MKAKVKLHSREPSGRIDTYHFKPYPKQVPTENKALNPKTNAYSVNYSQACLLLQAIQVNDRRRISSECIFQLASFVAKSWESEPNNEKIQELAKLISNLLDTTLLSPEKTLDEALSEFCSNSVPTHTVSPSITLLIAIGYIERLKQKYNNVKGTTGCGQRLILVAYMIAAKFMHVNLKSLINTTKCRKPSIDKLINTEEEMVIPSYLKEALPSPPTSPISDSDPLNYHYFNSPKDKKQMESTHQEHHHQILRMEIEFLHFLNYDLSITNTFKLIHWARKFDDNLLPPIKKSPDSPKQ